MTRWADDTGGTRGSTYDERFTELAATGANVHGEADLVASLLPPGTPVLDAGCGTGRVAIELARRGYTVIGVDTDASMLDVARRKAPDLDWRLADLAAVRLDAPVDVALLAGNVMIFLAPGTEGAVLERVAASLGPAGLLVAGFSLQPGRLDLATYDALATEVGLTLVDRWASWDRAPYVGGDYAVSVHAVQRKG